MKTELCMWTMQKLTWSCVLLLVSMSMSMSAMSAEAKLVSKTYTMALPQVLGGMVINTRAGKTLMEMPAGRIALKAFNGELVEARDPEYVFEAGSERDEDFVPVPLSKLCTIHSHSHIHTQRERELCLFVSHSCCIVYMLTMERYNSVC